MKDLTQGSISKHLLAMSFPIAAGMVFQTLYYVVDLYFVAQLGDAAIAGVSIAGNIAFLVIALTQMLGIGTVALVSQAAGRKDQADANLAFNQSVLLSMVFGLITLLAGFAAAGAYVRAVAADEASAAAATTYLYWFLPGLALQFAMVAMGSALRGTGIVRPTIGIQILTVLLNTALAPVLIAGWGTHHPLGIAGAGLATTLSVAVGVVMLWFYFERLEKYVALHREQLRPRLDYCKRILGIGLPGGGELVLLTVYSTVIYYAIQKFGPSAQAGFGVGMRVIQGLTMPAMAICMAAAPIAGQNFGARKVERVRKTFRTALLMGFAVMVVLVLLCQWRPDLPIRIFTSETGVLDVGGLFLRFVSWNFIASAFIFTASSLFQAFGNTWPSLLSSCSRLITFAVPLLWLSRRPGFQLEHLLYLSVTTTYLQAVLSLLLLNNQFRKRLGPMAAKTVPSVAAGG